MGNNEGIKPKTLKECEFSIQFFGKTNILKIDDIENLNLEKLNYLIL